MILDVTKVQQVDQEEKPTIYKVIMKGSDGNLVKMTLTIECDSKVDIQRYVPLMIGERRRVDFGHLNHTLGDFGPALDADELVMCIMQIDEHIKSNELKIRTLVNTNEELNVIKRDYREKFRMVVTKEERENEILYRAIEHYDPDDDGCSWCGMYDLMRCDFKGE